MTTFTWAKAERKRISGIDESDAEIIFKRYTSKKAGENGCFNIRLNRKAMIECSLLVGDRVQIGLSEDGKKLAVMKSNSGFRLCGTKKEKDGEIGQAIAGGNARDWMPDFFKGAPEIEDGIIVIENKPKNTLNKVARKDFPTVVNSNNDEDSSDEDLVNPYEEMLSDFKLSKPAMIKTMIKMIGERDGNVFLGLKLEKDNENYEKLKDLFDENGIYFLEVSKDSARKIIYKKDRMIIHALDFDGSMKRAPIYFKSISLIVDDSERRFIYDLNNQIHFEVKK